MSHINNYILKQLLTLFGFFALVLVLIYWINRAVRLFDESVSYTHLTLPTIYSV